MKFSYNWLQSYFNKKLPKPDKLAEILTLHFAEVEAVEKAGNDFSLDIDVRPNRAGDCFSHNGIAREIAAILDYKMKVGNTKFIEDRRKKATDLVSVSLQGRGPCPRYTARVMRGIKIGPSPKWIQERLIACGLRPISNVVDATNYVMLESGQPLHAFDLEKVEGRKIIVRFAKPGEKIVSLDGVKYDLDDDILVIANSKSPMAIAGIKGGEGPEIDKNTKTIVIEAANFDSQTIRRASKKIGLRTDASLRFEHGLDPNLTQEAADRAAWLIKKIARGEIARGEADIYPKKVLPKIIKLDLNYVESLLGVEIPQKTMVAILEKLGFALRGRISKDSVDVVVPTRRVDVSIQEDLIEEIGRIYGYEKIPAVLPRTTLAVPEINAEILWQDIAKDALKEAGFSEVYNYSFISSKDVSIFRFGRDELIEVSNPLSLDFQYLTPSLLPNLLKNVERNQKNFQQIKIFESGKVFSRAKEGRMITGLVSGNVFYELKGAVDLTLNRLGISDIWYDDYRTQKQDAAISWFHPKKFAEIKIGQERIGFLGEISQIILSEYRINQKVIYFDIFFDKLSRLALEENEYRPISKFPAAVRDIAVLVPRQVKAEDVFSRIETEGGELVRDVDLFDIYEGQEIAGQKKNFAFHIIFQAEDRTLSSSEIDGIQDKIIKGLESEPEWQVRR